MMGITEKFKQKYIPGFDCRLSTFRNTLAMNDIVISNSMILGLSGSFMFCFNDHKSYSRLPYFVVSGINDQSLESLAFNLNLYLFRGRMYDIDSAKSEILKYLSIGLPINIAINRLLLQQYCGQVTNQINMGHHYVTITNYIPKTDKFTIFETDTSKEITLDSKILDKIWFSDLKNRRIDIDLFQVCDGQWYSFKCKPLDKDQLIKACLNGIYKTVSNFFNSPIPEVIGIEALSNFVKTITTLNKVRDYSYIKNSILILNAMVSGMSGGGLGRKLFSYFLSEYSSLIENEEIKNIAISYTELAKDWDHLAKELNLFYLKNEIKNKLLFESVTAEIKFIESKEISCMKQLSDYLKFKI